MKARARGRRGSAARGLLTLVCALAPIPQDGLERLPGEADGELTQGLARALRGRDVIGSEWAAEGRVAEWTDTLRELVTGSGPITAPIAFRDQRASEWTRTFESADWTVDRRDPGSASDLVESPLSNRAALAEFFTNYRVDGGARTALKIVGVEREGAPVTLVRMTSFSIEGNERIQHLAHLRAKWAPRDTDAPAGPSGPSGSAGSAVSLERSNPIELVWESEERAAVRGPGPAFADSTASAFAAPLPNAWQLGLDRWRLRLDSLLDAGLLGHQGLAVADIDANGWEDLYLPQPGGLPNRLYLSDANGKLRDHSKASGADYLDRTSSALLLDFDGDSHIDLVLATTEELLWLAGDGAGAFELRQRIPAATTTSLAASDYDLDGDLDIYVCGYLSPYDDSATPRPYHDANNGERNQLLRNDGDFQFTDVTESVGLDENNRRFTFAASWSDFDRDGDPDLYVANDFGRNNLYRNDGERFTDVALELGVEDMAAGMGVAWGDIDNDGWEDLYVSNMFSAAGSRLATGPAFHPQGDATTREALLRHARGNTLFLNKGGAFEDATAAAGVGMGRWAWGSILFDMNTDGWLDCLVPNGMITGARDDDL